MVDGYSFDPRCHKDTVTQWLDEFVSMKGSLMLQVAQAADGSLSGASELHGVISAAGEALRTGEAVEIVTTFSPQALASFTEEGEVEGGASADRRKKWLGLRAAAGSGNDRAVVLVVPNRCITLSQQHDNAAYVIVRAAGPPPTSIRAPLAEAGVVSDRDTDAEVPFSNMFKAADKVLFKSAVGLTCRALFRASSKYSFEQMRRMELDLAQERAILAKVRHGVLASEHMQRRSINTPAEFSHEVEVGVNALLHRGAADPCDVDCFFWFIPDDFSSAATDLGKFKWLLLNTVSILFSIE